MSASQIQHDSITTRSVELKNTDTGRIYPATSVSSITRNGATSRAVFEMDLRGLQAGRYTLTASGVEGEAVRDEVGGITTATELHSFSIAEVPLPATTFSPSYEASELITTSLSAPSGYTIDWSKYRIDSPNRYGFAGGDGLTYVVTIGSISTFGTYSVTLYGEYTNGSPWELTHEFRVVNPAPTLNITGTPTTQIPFQVEVIPANGVPFVATYKLYSLTTPVQLVQQGDVLASAVDLVLADENKYRIEVLGTYTGEIDEWRVVQDFYVDDPTISNAFSVTNRSASGFPVVASGATIYRSTWVDLWFTAISGAIQTITPDITHFVAVAFVSNQWQSRIYALDSPRTINFTITYVDGETQLFALTVAKPVQEAPGIYDLADGFTANLQDTISWRVGNPDPAWAMESLTITTPVSNVSFSSGYADINQVVRSAAANASGPFVVEVTYTHDGGIEDTYTATGTIESPPLPALANPTLIIPETITVGIPALIFWNDSNIGRDRTSATTTIDGVVTNQDAETTSHSFYYTARSVAAKNVSVELVYPDGTVAATEPFTPVLPAAPTSLRVYYSGTSFFVDWSDRVEPMADEWILEANGAEEAITALPHTSGAKTWRYYQPTEPTEETVYRVAMVWAGERTAFSEPVTYTPPALRKISDMGGGPVWITVLIEGYTKPLSTTRGAALTAAQTADPSGSNPDVRGNAFLDRLRQDTTDLWWTIKDTTSDPGLAAIADANATYLNDNYLMVSLNCSLLGQGCQLANFIENVWAKYLGWMGKQTIETLLSFDDWVQAGEPS